MAQAIVAIGRQQAEIMRAIDERLVAPEDTGSDVTLACIGVSVVLFAGWLATAMSAIAFVS